MKVRLLYASFLLVFITVSCSTKKDQVIYNDLPDKGRIAYVISTEPLNKAEAMTSMNHLKRELLGDIVYYPESGTINQESILKNDIVIRFVKKFDRLNLTVEERQLNLNKINSFFDNYSSEFAHKPKCIITILSDGTRYTDNLDETIKP